MLYGKYAPLSQEEQRELVRRWQTSGNEQALERLMLSCVGLVKSTAHKRYHGIEGVSFTDLVQEGMIGLRDAATKFDLVKYGGKVKYSTYAAYWVRKRMLEFILGNSGSLVTGGHRNQANMAIRKLKRLIGEEVEQEGAVFDWGQIAQRLGKSEETLRLLWPFAWRSSELRLDRHVREDSATTFHDLIGDETYRPDRLVGDTLGRESLQEAMTAAPLSFMERFVIERRFLTDPSLTLIEVGEECGVTRERIRQVEEKALGKLRDYVGHPRIGKETPPPPRLEERVSAAERFVALTSPETIQEATEVIASLAGRQGWVRGTVVYAAMRERPRWGTIDVVELKLTLLYAARRGVIQKRSGHGVEYALSSDRKEVIDMPEVSGERTEVDRELTEIVASLGGDDGKWVRGRAILAAMRGRERWKDADKAVSGSALWQAGKDGVLRQKLDGGGRSYYALPPQESRTAAETNAPSPEGEGPREEEVAMSASNEIRENAAREAATIVASLGGDGKWVGAKEVITAMRARPQWNGVKSQALGQVLRAAVSRGLLRKKGAGLTRCYCSASFKKGEEESGGVVPSCSPRKRMMRKLTAPVRGPAEPTTSVLEDIASILGDHKVVILARAIEALAAVPAKHWDQVIAVARVRAAKQQ